MSLKVWTATCPECGFKVTHHDYSCKYCNIGKIMAKEIENEAFFPSFRYICDNCGKEQFTIHCPECNTIID